MNYKFTDNSDEAIREMNKKIEGALTAMGVQAEKYAKLELENYPRRIDTGFLRNSITYAVEDGETAISSYTDDKKTKKGSYSGSEGSADDHTVYIGTNVSYGVYVHEGTDRMVPNRFLRNAVANHETEYNAIANKVMKNG